jgi:hypothetical protein
MCIENLLSPLSPRGLAAWPTPSRQREDEAVGTELDFEYRALLHHVVARAIGRPTVHGSAPAPAKLGMRLETFAQGLDALCVFNAIGMPSHTDTHTLVHSMLLWARLACGTPPTCVHTAMACWTVAGKCQNGGSITRERLIHHLWGAWDWEPVQYLDWLLIRRCGLQRAAAVHDEVAVLKALEWDVGMRRAVPAADGDVDVFDPVQIAADVFALYDPSLVAAAAPAVAEHKAFDRTRAATDKEQQAFSAMLWRELTMAITAALGVVLPRRLPAPHTPQKAPRP